MASGERLVICEWMEYQLLTIRHSLIQPTRGHDWPIRRIAKLAPRLIQRVEQRQGRGSRVVLGDIEVQHDPQP